MKRKNNFIILGIVLFIITACLLTLAGCFFFILPGIQFGESDEDHEKRRLALNVADVEDLTEINLPEDISELEYVAVGINGGIEVDGSFESKSINGFERINPPIVCSKTSASVFDYEEELKYLLPATDKYPPEDFTYKYPLEDLELTEICSYERAGISFNVYVLEIEGETSNKLFAFIYFEEGKVLDVLK